MTDNQTVKFKSTRFGDLEVSSLAVITILGGVIGFPDATKYVLLEYNPPFSWLHSVENPDLAFVCVNGAEFGELYSIPLPLKDTELNLSEDNPDIAIINLVSVRPDPTMTTVNLKAPVVVNLGNRKGRQIIIDNPNFPTRLPLWGEGIEAKK
jgi:flagellar assembly factor FliW